MKRFVAYTSGLRSPRAAALVTMLALALGVWAVPRGATHAAADISGLKVQGNQIVNDAGQPVRLLGVDRSGTEYACIQGWGIFDGPNDAASVQAIASWHTNAVRVPLNEDCWLNINGAPAAYSGTTYQNAIINYVNLLNANGLVAILDLHWNAAGTAQATGQQPMPDEDHAPAFWKSVATTFKGNSSVIFDLYNEPYPDSNQDTSGAWQCWRDGVATGTSGCPGVSYKVAGMQELVNDIRGVGATNILMLGGVEYSNSLTQWLTYEPQDSLNNLAASWHSYNFNICTTLTCWNNTIAPVAAKVPVIAGEIGENDCAHGYIDQLMPWMDSHGVSYLGWTWDTWNCSSGPALISDYTGTPTNFGAGFQSHLAALASNATPTPTGTSGNTPTPTATPVPATVTINSASANPTTVAPGGSTTLSTTVTSSASISGAIIDFEIYDSANTKVYQTYQSTNLAANTPQSYTASWPVSATQAAGSYTLEIGVFGPNWTPNYAWDSSGATITVSTTSPTATPTPTATATPLPPPSAPQNLTASTASKHSSGINLSWLAPASTGGAAITGYRIYRGTASGAETLLTTTTGTGRTYGDRSTTSGHVYYYQVSAVTTSEGPRSNEAHATAR